MDELKFHAYQYHLRRLTEDYGPILCLADVGKELGKKTPGATYVASSRGQLPVAICRVGGKPSVLASDLAAFLAGLSAQSPSAKDAAPAKRGRPSKASQIARRHDK